MASPEAAAILRELQGKNGNGVRILLLNLLFRAGDSSCFFFFLSFSLLPRRDSCVWILSVFLSLSQTRRASSEYKFDFESAISARFIFHSLSFCFSLSLGVHFSKKKKRRKRFKAGRGRES